MIIIIIIFLKRRKVHVTGFRKQVSEDETQLCLVKQVSVTFICERSNVPEALSQKLTQFVPASILLIL